MERLSSLGPAQILAFTIVGFGAQSAPAEIFIPRWAETQMIATGACVKLRVGKYDSTEGCKSELVSATAEPDYARLEFSHGHDFRQTVTFIGRLGKSDGAGGRTLNVSEVSVFFGIEEPPVVSAATGTCVWGDLTRGPTAVSCSVMSRGDRYSAEFRVETAVPRPSR